MPKLRAVVDNLDDVPESVREFYAQGADGKFRLDADAVAEAEEFKQKYGKANKAGQKRREELARWEALGLTPEEVQERLAKIKEGEEEAHKAKGDIEALQKQWLADKEREVARIKQQHERELAAKDEKIARLAKQRDKHMLEDKARAAIAAAHGVPDLLLPHVLRQMAIVEDEEGNAEARVVTDTGEPRLADSRGTPFTVDKLLEEMKGTEVYARAFDGVGGNGSGSRPGTASGSNRSGGLAKAEWDKLPPSERLARLNERSMGSAAGTRRSA